MDLVPGRAERIDDRPEGAGIEDRLRRDHRPGTPAAPAALVKHHGQHVTDRVAPQRPHPSVAAHSVGQHPAQPDAQVLGITHETARYSPVQFKCRLRLTDTVWPVEPDEHGPEASTGTAGAPRDNEGPQGGA
jgi:hypothetical protein